ncbi:unnamed protein product [Urochloa decumbens]|uniref:DUF1618 domain-containing protein n=1 Tax=Urochloa decumbens TaxID=240449 RepID=A0ABC8Y351_9POAL
MSAAAGFPNWVLLEPFVFRRDDESSFPDESKAPIRASGITSWGARFSIAFSVADPPHISHLYARLPQPGFLGPDEMTPLAIVATHRHLVLLGVDTLTPQLLGCQNFFIYDANEDHSSLLQMLPPCTESNVVYTRDDGSVPPSSTPRSTPRLLDSGSMGIWCRGEGFMVAELSRCQPSDCSKVFADIYLLRSSSSSESKWAFLRAEILSTNKPYDEDLWQLCFWQTETVIPFKNWLCWMDYHQGILFCDMMEVEVATPTVSFLRFPLDESPTITRTATSSFFYRGASVVDHGRALKFVNVTRHDGIPFGALKPGTGFTITCNTLILGDGISSSMKWEKDYTVTSKELWDTNKDRLPHGILMFPRVDIDRPYVVHFLLIEFGYAKKKMWVVSIDMNTRTVESFFKYIDGWDGLQGDDADLIMDKSMSPMPFLPCEFPRFCNLSRYVILLLPYLLLNRFRFCRFHI